MEHQEALHELGFDTHGSFCGSNHPINLCSIDHDHMSVQQNSLVLSSLDLYVKLKSNSMLADDADTDAAAAPN